MKTITYDEAADLMEALLHALKTIVISDSADKQRIANARYDAERFAATIAHEMGSARPRISACLKRYEAYRMAGDVKATGWILAAIEERIAERDLADWRKLKTVANMVTRALPRPETAAVH